MSELKIIANNNILCQFERSRELVRHTLIILLLLLISLNSFANKDLQEKAQKAYSEKNYKEAINAYETILKEGLTSYKLHYNLGNAYYKNNELGKAIYNYELALKLQPNNKDIKTNLKIASEKTIDKIESKENFFIGALKSGLVNSLSTNGWAWTSIISLTSALALAFLFFIANQITLKRIGFFLSGISIIVFISSMLLGFTSLKDKQVSNFAIILNREVKIYDEPVTDSSSKFTLHEGTKVNVLESNSDWTNIKLENGNEGWIKTSTIGVF